jgi:hypothetical protein
VELRLDEVGVNYPPAFFDIVAVYLMYLSFLCLSVWCNIRGSHTFFGIFMSLNINDPCVFYCKCCV